jgi:hypothetical protein
MSSSQDTKDRPQVQVLSEGKYSVDAKPVRVDGMSYTVDNTNTIVAVSGVWDEFARDNGGENILASKIIGRQLEQFIQGDDTRMFVRTMLMSARTLHRPIYRPYRCDSPTLKRFMEMTLLPRADGVLEVIHRELHNEPIFHNIPVVAAPSGAGWAFLKRCSLCNRVHAQGVWSEIDDAIEANRLQVNAPNLKVIYGVCPDCLTRRGIPL